jgi:hypothetical protein
MGGVVPVRISTSEEEPGVEAATDCASKDAVGRLGSTDRFLCAAKAVCSPGSFACSSSTVTSKFLEAVKYLWIVSFSCVRFLEEFLEERDA